VPGNREGVWRSFTWWLQEVFHIHLHVFPRFIGDGFRIDADWRVRERAELDAAAAAVRDGSAKLA
jgi:diadenosine tetraphosphate (Ap4A) HIT family hydrolase